MADSSINSVNESRHEVIGKMTFTTVPDLLKHSKTKFDAAGTEIIFDLEKVKHVDSAGLALMLELLRLAKNANKNIKFVKIPPQLQNLTEITGLSQIIIQTHE